MNLFLTPVKWKQRGKPSQAGANPSLHQLPLAKCFVDALVPGFLRFLNQGQKQGRGVSFFFFGGGTTTTTWVPSCTPRERSTRAAGTFAVLELRLPLPHLWLRAGFALGVVFPLRGWDGMRLMPRQPGVPILTPGGKTHPAFPERKAGLQNSLPRDGRVLLCQKATKIHPKIIPSNWEGFFFFFPASLEVLLKPRGLSALFHPL